MVRIPVEQAESGMVLAESVNDRRGRLLIPAGIPLEEKHLDALPMWGVTLIDVEGNEPESSLDAPLEVTPWAMDQATEEMERLFLLANTDHPVIKVLKTQRLTRRALEIQKGAGHGK